MTEPTGPVLVVKIGGLAGFVQALPAMKAIRRGHRGVHVMALTATAIEGLANDTPYFDEVDAEEDFAAPGVIARVAARLKRFKFSRVYDLERSELSERLYQAMRPSSAAWSGPARGAKHKYLPPPELHVVDVSLSQVAAAGLEAQTGAFPDASWAATARGDAPSLKPAFFGLRKPFVLIAPSAQRDGAPPRWPSARFAGLAARLAARGVDVAIVGEPDDRLAARAIAQACPEAKDLAARADLTQIAALSTAAGGVFGHADAGVLHLAAAAGAPTLSIAPSREAAERLGPRGSGVVTLAAADPYDLSVEDAASTLGMFSGIGALKGAAASNG